MGKQAVIYFKNGTRDWVDPIDDESRDVFYGHNIITIVNGAGNEYSYIRELVDRVEFIELDDTE